MSRFGKQLVGFFVVALIAGTADAAAISFGPNDIRTLFYIEKSNNRDRVDYGIRLDQNCRPTTEDAVFPYWRDLAHTPVHVHTLGTFAAMAYGVSAQHTARKTNTGADHGIVLKKIDRPIWVTTSKGENGRCTAVVRTTIAGVKYAELLSIYVKLAGAISVDYVDVKGRDLATGRALAERIQH